MEAAGISAGVALDHHDDDHAHEHHGPPPANRSSRVSHEVLGMLLFIISEIMVFGAFFAAYFFIRLVAGMVGDPDPYTATMNALQFYKVSRIIVSTLPVTRSGWLRADLITRLRKASNIEVEHIVAEQQSEQPDRAAAAKAPR